MQTRHYAVWPEGLPHRLEPVEHSIYHNLVLSASKAPERPAIVYYGRSLSYRDLLDEVRRLASYLRHQGVAKDDRVAVFLQNSPQFVIAYYAVLAANAVVVPVNPMCREAELRHILEDCDARALVFGSELGQTASSVWGERDPSLLIVARYGDYIDPATDLELPAEVASSPEANGTPWAEALGGALSFPETDSRPGDWCMIPYSSGTTGHPKGCLHTHSSVNATVQGYRAWVGMGPGDRVLATLPFCHVTGMQHSMNLPLAAGGTIFLTTRWNARTAAELISRERIEHWRSITTMMIDFLSLPDIETYDLSSLKALGGGGAQMPRSVARKMADLIGLTPVEGYGLTETAAPTHLNPPAAARGQCLGIPIFGVDARVVDPESRTELGPDQQGEIIVDAPQLFQGYWRRPEETEAAFMMLDGKRFFRTGDIGYYDDFGYFYFSDRLKRMINVAGLKVWPAEVEAILHGHPDIAEACVVGDTDPRRGETVRAVIVPRSGIGEMDTDALSEWCRCNMAAYKVPRQFEFRSDLPRTAAGKVLWKDL